MDIQSEIRKMMRLGESLGGSKDGKKEVEIEIGFGPDEMMLLSAAEDLLKAIEDKDAKAVAMAFKEMFESCEKEPHDEYEHDEDE